MELFYIADSAAFTKKFLEKTKNLNVEVITHMPDNIKETKIAFEYALIYLDVLKIVEVPTSTKPPVYSIHEIECTDKDIPLQ